MDKKQDASNNNAEGKNIFQNVKTKGTLPKLKKEGKHLYQRHSTLPASLYSMSGGNALQNQLRLL